MRLARTPTAEPKRSPLSLPIKMPSHKTPELVPSGNGTHTKQQLGWSAKVGRDGRVKFKDKPSFRITRIGPCFSCIGKALRGYAENPDKFQKRKVPIVAIPIIAGIFDVTDWLMRRNKQDPYSYQKAQFLERTRGQRMLLAAEARSAHLRNALFSLRRRLNEVWNNIAWSHRERRRVLFDLWDECAETGSREVVSTAAQVRATIVAFVRHHLPETSRHRYTLAELKTLNARKKSRQLFLPYER